MGVAGTAARLAVLILSVPAGGVGGIICYTCDDKGTEVGEVGGRGERGEGGYPRACYHDNQGVIKRCRLSWLTNSALVYARGGGGVQMTQLYT
jgi:hypothetical protein